jgi:hypothetical protein
MKKIKGRHHVEGQYQVANAQRGLNACFMWSENRDPETGVACNIINRSDQTISFLIQDLKAGKYFHQSLGPGDWAELFPPPEIGANRPFDFLIKTG